MNVYVRFTDDTEVMLTDCMAPDFEQEHLMVVEMRHVEQTHAYPWRNIKEVRITGRVRM